jgi:hypothetical protein
LTNKGFKCQWLDKKIIWEKAENIRNEHWPEGILPVNMEEIIEIKLGLTIEPMHGLFCLIDMDAYLKMDLSGIVIDYDCYMHGNFSNRLRFSLAHELGHYYLHKEIYSDLTFNSPEEWKDFVIYSPENEYANFEWQANEFAGRFLVPREALKTKIAEVCESLKKNNMIDYLAVDPDAVLSSVSPFLRKPFGVSEEVIERRVKREDLWPPDLH